MRTTIAKRWSFDAAHRLPDHDGKCAQPHGHTYTVEVAVSGPVREGGPKDGMVLDFGTLGWAWNRLEPLLDHQDLNETLVGMVEPTTSENIAAWLYEQFSSRLEGDGVEVAYVRVSETAATWAEVRP